MKKYKVIQARGSGLNIWKISQACLLVVVVSKWEQFRSISASGSGLKIFKVLPAGGMGLNISKISVRTARGSDLKMEQFP